MMNSNEQILDAIIRRAVALEQYKNGSVRRILKVLNQSTFPDVQFTLTNELDKIKTEGQRRRLIEKIDRLYNEGIAAAREALNTELGLFAKQETKWTKLTIESAIPAELNVTLLQPSAAQIRNAWLGKPFDGFLLRDYWKQINARQKQFLRQQLAIGFAEGESVPQMVRRVRGGFDGTRRQVTAVVRTAVTHTSTAVRDELYSENTDLIKGVRWVSTLDGRTTLICMGLDGKVYKVGEGPRPPAHIGCRSTTTPELKSLRELGFKGQFSEATRASMNGQTAERMTYPQWLRTQTKEQQNKILGPSRARLWRGNRLTIDKFTNNQRQVLTLDQLDAF